MQKVAQVAAVAVTKIHRILFSVLLFGSLSSTQAAVVPEDRTDILYHSYDGGGITIDGRLN